jgi:hypothetical protein
MTTDELTWFTEDDIAIVGNMICSKCLQEIPETLIPPTILRPKPPKLGAPMTLSREREGREEVAPLHWQCAEELMRTGVINVNDILHGRQHF